VFIIISLSLSLSLSLLLPFVVKRFIGSVVLPVLVARVCKIDSDLLPEN